MAKKICTMGTALIRESDGTSLLLIGLPTDSIADVFKKDKIARIPMNVIYKKTDIKPGDFDEIAITTLENYERYKEFDHENSVDLKEAVQETFKAFLEHMREKDGSSDQLIDKLRDGFDKEFKQTFGESMKKDEPKKQEPENILKWKR